MAALTRTRRRASTRIERWFAAQGRPPRLDLARSGAAPRRVEQILALHPEGSLEELLELSLDYGPGVGEARLREAIADAGSARRAGEVLVTHGAAEALLLACASTPRRSGTAIVATPAYDGVLQAPLAAGFSVRRVTVWREAEPGRLCWERLVRALERGAADLVVVNSPHNPTGLRVSISELDHLARACAVAGARLVVDEVARGTLDPLAPSAVSSEGFAAGTMLVAGDISKALGLGGLRCGWLTSAAAAPLRRAAATKDVTTVANARPAQLLAAMALEAGAALTAAPRAWAHANLGVLAASTRRCGGSLTVPADGLVAYPRLPLGGGACAAAARLRRDAAVAVVPGSLFGHPERLRLGLGIDPALFLEALGHIEDALGRWAA